MALAIRNPAVEFQFGTNSLGNGNGESQPDDSDESFMQEDIDDLDNPAISGMGPGIGTDRETDTDSGPSPVSRSEYAEPETSRQDTQQSATTAERTATAGSSQDTQQSASAAAAGGSSADPPSDPPDDNNTDKSLATVDSRDEFDEMLGDEWSDKQKDDMWELASQIDGGDGQSPTEALAKEVVGPTAGKVAGAVASVAGFSALGPAGLLLGPAAEAATAGTISYITKQAIDTGFKEGFSQACNAATQSFQGMWQGTKNLAGGDRSLLGGGAGSVSDSNDKYS